MARGRGRPYRAEVPQDTPFAADQEHLPPLLVQPEPELAAANAKFTEFIARL